VRIVRSPGIFPTPDISIIMLTAHKIPATDAPDKVPPAA
jgi:hypothetical protein